MNIGTLYTVKDDIYSVSFNGMTIEQFGALAELIEAGAKALLPETADHKYRDHLCVIPKYLEHIALRKDMGKSNVSA